MDFKKLNKIGLCEGKSTKRLEDLDEGKQYKLLELKSVKTQYGDKIVAVTEDFETFLPARFRTELTDDEIKQSKEECSKSHVVMFYRGKKDLGEGKSTSLVELQTL